MYTLYMTTTTTTKASEYSDTVSQSITNTYDSYDRYRKPNYDKDDMTFYKKLSMKRRREIDQIEKALKKVSAKTTPLRFKILESPMDIKLKALAIDKLDHISCMDPSSSEVYKMRNWIENLSRLPIGKYRELPVCVDDGVEKISGFIDQCANRLDEVVYGHKEAKGQILRLLAKWISNPQSKGLVIGIEGVHGVGKTSLVKDGICKVLDLPFGFVTLGGISDGSYMVGHSYTYEGSRWGKIADMLMQCGCMNPVFYFDELDKVSATTYGEEVSNFLIHLTDSSQNDHIQDKYFSELNLDLSRALIIFSYNNAELINPILRDRMTIIKAKGYDVKDKCVIAKQYMLPKIYEEYGYTNQDIIIEEDVLKHIIHVTDDEQGVRNLKRSLEEIVSQINLHNLLKRPILKNKHIQLRFTVDKALVDFFVKKKSSDTHRAHNMMYI